MCTQYTNFHECSSLVRQALSQDGRELGQLFPSYCLRFMVHWIRFKENYIVMMQEFPYELMARKTWCHISSKGGTHVIPRPLFGFHSIHSCLAGLAASPCLTTSYRSWRTPVWRERRLLGGEISVSVWRIDEDRQLIC